MNRTKIILVSVSDEYQLQVAHKLQKKGYDLSHSIMAKKYSTEDLGNIDVFYAKNLSDPEYYQRMVEKSSHSLSEELIKEFYELESIFLMVSDRLSYYAISVGKRKSLYYDILLFWYSFFKDNQVDLVIFQTTPHMGYDPVLNIFRNMVFAT